MRRRLRVVVLLPLLSLALGGCPRWHQVQHVELLEPTDVLRAPTADGEELALHHYPAAGAPVSPYPVLVCHGIASNRHTWSLGADRDIGAYLAAEGFDTYLVDLRGHGDSSEVDPSTSIDTYATLDVPAAIEAVRTATGAQKVVWIGHSMGGLVLVAHLVRVPDAPVAGAVTVGSPLDWRGGDRLTRMIPVLLGLIHGPLPARGLTGFYARWQGEIPFDLDRVVYEPSNMGRRELADMMRVGLSPIQTGVQHQFAASIRAGAFVSADGTLNYLDAAPDLRQPFLVIAGRADHLSPPERTVTFYDRLGSTDKTWRVFGKDQGDARDYGHVDLCNGDHAREDVYPFIAAWLRERFGP